jgi:hypothetical protein
MDCDKITKPSRLSVKSLRKSVNALKRKVEKEVRRQETILLLHKEQAKLSERLSELTAEGQDTKLYYAAQEEYRIEKNERRY